MTSNKSEFHPVLPNITDASMTEVASERVSKKEKPLNKKVENTESDKPKDNSMMKKVIVGVLIVVIIVLLILLIYQLYKYYNAEDNVVDTNIKPVPPKTENMKNDSVKNKTDN